MKQKVSIGRIIFGIGCILILIFGVFTSIDADAAKIEKSKEKTVETDRMTMTISYGYGKYVKYGRYMGVHANITNLSDDFTGKICALVPDTSEKSMLYSKNISIAKGETKEIEFSIPVTFVNGLVKFSVTDEKDKTILEKEVRITVESNIDTFYIGILSDEYASLNYLSSSKVRTVLLEADSFPRDEKALNMLDIIVINNFNTKKLSEEQYDALKSFVENGGTLVLGLGSTANKTLQVFQDDFLTGTMKELTKETIYFDEKKEVKATKDVQDIVLEDSKPLFQQKGKEYIQKKAAGLGSICVFQFDLSLEQELWDTVGEKVLSYVQKSISKTKQEQLQNEYIGNSNSYSISNGLNVVDNKNMPKVGSYAVVLIIYLFIIGPPSYFVLKKLDKRNFIWLFVPACAVLFTVVIYFMGSNTRIKEPIMNYMSVTKADGVSAQEEAYFQIMTPSNQSYQVSIPADYTLASALSDSWYTSEDKLPDYSVEINYGSEENKVIMKDVSAFESAKFKTTGSKKLDGVISSKIKFDHFEYNGTITNESKYDLKDAVAIIDNKIYKVGDFKAGETKRLEECTAYKYNLNDIYSNELTTKLLNGEPYNTKDADNKRKYYAMEYYLTENALKGANQVFGFIEEKEETILKSIRTKKEGVQLLSFSLDVNYQKGSEIIIPNITSYYELEEGNYDYNNIIYEPVTFKVQFDKGDRITSLLYSKELNPEFEHSQTTGGFFGKVMAFNNDTNSYDTIFESEKEGVVKNLKPYLDDNNAVRLQIIPEQKKKNYADSEIYIPTLSVTKEDK